MDTVGIVLTFVIFGGIAAVGVLLCLGKGVGLIAGYNTLSRAQKEKYDVKKLTRFVGVLVLGIDAMAVAGVLLSALTKQPIYGVGSALISFAAAIAAVVYANTGSRFRK